MSKTVSFVARDELAEWLESQADDQMKTVSSVVQDIIAKEFKASKGASEADKRGEESEPTGPFERSPFTDHPEAWYEPKTQDPDHLVAVRIPEDKNLAEDRRYYKTIDGAAESIRRWYE